MLWNNFRTNFIEDERSYIYIAHLWVRQLRKVLTSILNKQTLLIVDNPSQFWTVREEICVTINYDKVDYETLVEYIYTLLTEQLNLNYWISERLQEILMEYDYKL
jgi:hypothetical protein